MRALIGVVESTNLQVHIAVLGPTVTIGIMDNKMKTTIGMMENKMETTIGIMEHQISTPVLTENRSLPLNPAGFGYNPPHTLSMKGSRQGSH